MHVGIAKAKKCLPQLIRSAEAGEEVVITRRGKPVVRLAPPPAARRHVRFGGMRERMELLPGWDDPVDVNHFLAGNI